MAKAMAKLGVIIKLADGRSFRISEGDVVYGLKFIDDGCETVIDNGRVSVICGTTKTSATVPNDCIPLPYMHHLIDVVEIIVDSSTNNMANINRIDISDIISISRVKTEKQVEEENMIVTGIGDQYRPLVDVLNDAPAGSTIKLLSGEYNSPLTINKDITICADGDVTLNSLIELKNESDELAPLRITFDGLVFSDQGMITSAGTSELTIRHCVFGGFEPEESSQPIHFLSTNPDPILVNIENCEFMSNNDNCYNLMNIYAPFKDGSRICHNIFRKGCCTHNQIALFAVENGATIHICDNICEYSANMVHIQIPGSPKCTIMMENNICYSTDTRQQWSGLFMVQPFIERTVSYEDMVIHVNNCKLPEGSQVGYMYIGENNSILSSDKYPTVYVDGKLYKMNTDGVFYI